jgi:Zn-dependent peptidase ImmA (M78 family)/transcriptional regulator with XRE-family HTH domain
MPKVNPEILRWARESAGLTSEEAVEKLQLRPARGVSAIDRLAALESGEEPPSRPMLVKMAKKYHRPLLTFYLSTPPRSGERGQDFRTLPEGHAVANEGLLDALIRDVQVRQSIVRAVLEDEDEGTPLPFVGSMEMSDGVPSVLAAIRHTIGMDLAEFRAQPSPREAFGLLREAVEAAGVFVVLKGDLGSYHTAIDLLTFRGFTLADPVAPLLVINDQDAKAAWSFTLVHELVHLWLGQTGVSGERSELAIEQFCNAVASEFLLPAEELLRFPIDAAGDEEVIKTDISDFARDCNLSRSMVAYRLYQSGAIDRERWQRLSADFRADWLRERERQRERVRARKGGPDANVVGGHRVGNALLDFVARMMSAGALTTSKAGKVLGVRGKRVQALLDASGRRGLHRTA